MISDYTVALFAHILGVLGLFIGIAMDWITILRLRQARTAAQVRERTSLIGVQARLIQIASLLVLVAGIYMTVRVWGWNIPWILVALAAMIVMGALSGGVNARRLRAIQKAAEDTSETLPPVLQRQIVDPMLLTAAQTAGMVGVGVIFLMTTKPDWVGSLITLAVALVLGVVSAQPWRRPREAAVPVQEAKLG